MLFILKVFVSAIVIAAASEIAKRSTLWGALLLSLPLTSIIALSWLYLETGDSALVAKTSSSILWLVIPSLSFFLILSFALNKGISFGISLAAAISLTALGYLGFTWTLRCLNIQL